jgi:zinc transport system substrate-binding protein
LFQTVHGRAKNQTLFGLIGRASAPSPDRDAHDHAHDHAHGHGDGGEDPHLWLDPILVADEIVPALVRYLSEVDPSSAAHYRERGAQFSATLAQLDEELRTLLSGEARHYVAFHGAWKHFGARYALEQVAVVQEAPGEEPTPRELANLVRSARRLNLGAILVEPQLDPRIANTLSNEFGGTTVLVDPLGDPGDKARSTYPDLLRFNARAFRHAMALHAKGNSSP